ncbi:MAG TPA: alpha-glucuronidase family glycosyl hydrolase, partial [Gemmatimonadaceae bacterium]
MIAGTLRRAVVLALALLAVPTVRLRAEDGYDLWLRYPRVDDARLLTEYRGALRQVVVEGDSPTLRAARAELIKGLGGLLGTAPATSDAVTADGAVLVGTPTSSRAIAALPLTNELRVLGPEGYVVRAVRVGGHRTIVVAGNTDVGALYGTFALLRQL